MLRIGIICPSEIALRRFLPALSKLKDIKYVGVAVASVEEWFEENEVREGMLEVIKCEKEKATGFTTCYGGRIFDSYTDLIHSKEVDAVYIPLPPALHYKWAKLALLAGKHVLVEKPSCVEARQTKELISIAEQNGLAIHENYMFVFHDQLSRIDGVIKSGKMGEVRLYRLAFGFPRRGVGDFRYNKMLGGGALLDCGGYAIKYGSMLLGPSARVAYARLNYLSDFEVDIFGSAVMENDEGAVVQLGFGMDNSYKCELEVWGSKGTLITKRVFTAPEGFVPEMTLRLGNEIEIVNLPEDDSFFKSIRRFQECVEMDQERIGNYSEILRQAEFVDEFIKQAKIG